MFHNLQTDPEVLLTIQQIAIYNFYSLSRLFLFHSFQDAFV